MKIGDVVQEKLDVKGHKWLVIEFFYVGPGSVSINVPLPYDEYNAAKVIGIGPDNYGALWQHWIKNFEPAAYGWASHERQLVETLFG